MLPAPVGNRHMTARFDITGFEPRHFQWRQEGRVGVITLNRPERKNPLTFESYAELRDFFRALVEVQEVRAIVITGACGNFCSGGDVHEIIGPLTRMDAAGLRQFTQMTGDLVKAMRACPQPLVAAVDGVCAGAGAILAMASDFRLGTPRAKTAFLFTRVGLAGCDMGACAILPRLVGHGRASELLFTGRSMLAEEALSWGFFKGPTFAHAMTKQMLHAEWSMTVDAAIDAEAEAQAVCMETQDFHRAYNAFVAKQKPKFEGD
jgi:enoyl-CoA hydratase/carnithine racemase